MSKLTESQKTAAQRERELAHAEERAKEAPHFARAGVLWNLDKNPGTKALLAGIPIAGLIPYLTELKALGLIDDKERLTPAGAFYRALVKLATVNPVKPWLSRDYFPRRSVWTLVGGSEVDLDAAALHLRFADLIKENLDEPRGYALFL